MKNVINVINEQVYDDGIEKYKKERDREITIAQTDAKLLLTLAQNWCEGRVSHPDCEALMELNKKLQIAIIIYFSLA